MCDDIDKESDADLSKTKELFDFLQGVVPDGYSIPDDHIPHLTPDQAWTVVWYLGNLHWQVTDHIERCGVCGELYDTDAEGVCLDYGDPPYHFCMNCQASWQYAEKEAKSPDATAE